MTETFYRVLHVAGILLTFMSLGSLIACARAGDGASKSARFLAVIGHGVGLAVILVAGFGLQAKLKIEFQAGWFLAKIGIWFLLGASVALINRKAGLSTLWWWLTVGLGVTAAYLANYKPF